MSPKESILILLMKIRRNLTLRKEWVWDSEINSFSFIKVSQEELDLMDEMIKDIKDMTEKETKS